MRHYHETAGSSETNDPAEWRRASYNHHPCDDFEPLPDIPNPYREAALYHMRHMYACDEFVTGAEDTRLAIVAVAVVLGWPSARGLTLSNIAGQLGCTPAALTRSIARFKTMAGLGASAGGIRAGAGLSNDDTPAVYRTVKSTPLKS